MVAATGSPRAPTPSTRSRSCRSRPRELAGARAACSTSAAARARSPGWRRRSAAPSSSSASTRRGTRSPWPRERGGGPAYARAGADALPFADGVVRRRRRLPGVRAHRRRRRGDRRGRPGCSRPAAGSCFFLNHPLLQTPGQRLDRRPGPRPARAVLAHRARTSSRTRRSRRSRRACSSRFIHRPLSPLRERAGRRTACSIERMDEPAPPPGFLARAAEYADAATIPRLLYLRAAQARRSLR